MPSVKRSPDLSDWRDIANLGEQLVNTASLREQRDRIVLMTSQMVRGKVDVWLHENLFRLPDWKSERLFPIQPRSVGMRNALKRRKLYIKRANLKAGIRKTLAAFPIEDNGIILGVLQITRSSGPNFAEGELDLFKSIASVIAVGLYASHRVEVERFRLGQLNLVREVSAQIANVLDVDELSRRVTGLIQKTFNYYYVAIFTLQPGATRLRFRSSARAPKKGRKEPLLAFEVELGMGLIGEAALTGKRIIAADVRKDPRFRYLKPLPETRSEVVIPLKLEKQVLGVLDVQSDQVNAFHPNDLLLLQALTDNITRAVESARLYNDIRRRADQLSLVAEVGKSVTSTLDLGEMMDEAATLIHDRFRYPHVYLFTVHPNRRLIEYEAGSGTRSRALEGFTLSLDDPSGIIPWVSREGKTILANDVSKEPRYRPSPLPPKNIRSELCVPLLFGERVHGVLDVQSDRLNAFTNDDRIMFETVAGTMAASIRNADLYRSEQWRRRVADGLREVAGLLSENVGVDEALEAILVELDKNLPVDISTIWLLDEEDLFLAAVHGAKAEAIEHARFSSPELTGILSEIMQSEEPVIRKSTDPLWPTGKAAKFELNYSSLAVPLRVRDQPVGVLALAHHSPGRYGHEAQAMAATFGSYAAVAIQNARLYDTSQEQAYASAALLQVAQAIVSLSDLNDILSTIIRIMPILVGVERSVLYLWDATREYYIPSQEYGLPDKAKTMLWNTEFAGGKFPIMDLARRTGQPAAYPLRTKDNPENWMKLKPSLRENNGSLETNARLLIAVPLLIKADLFGLLLVEESDKAWRFRTRRLEIINGIAQQIALAIQNDRLQNEMVVRERLETEIQLARQIQKTFIPERLPMHTGWELAARWKTARQVGGDYYDVIELPDHKLGLIIADVADKGVPAALFMALTRTLVRAAAVEAPTPAGVLQRVNDLLMPDTSQGMFVTAVYAVLDQETGEFTYANAGHNPPLWIQSNREIVKLTRTGIALGLIDSYPISERTIQIHPGDSILLYTDGVTEAFSPAEDLFGEERLLDIIRSNSLATAESLLDAVEAGIDDFISSSPLSDDLTMMVIKRR